MRVVELRSGSLPTQCEPFMPRAADVMQRIDCARRRECVDHAVKAQWRAFTCEGCGVRETAVYELRVRCGGDQMQAWPELRK